MGSSIPGLAVVALLALWVLVVCSLGGWVRFRHYRSGLRRLVLRFRWLSVARSSGLAQTRDRRARIRFTTDAASAAPERVEYLPSIGWGRALPGGRGVRYRLRPARGGTISDVAEAAERLAAGLRVHRVEVERIRADKGRLIVVWSDPLDAVVAPPPRVGAE